MESETEKSVLEESTSEKSDAASMEQSDNDEPLMKLRQKRNAAQPQEQITWMKKETNRTTSNDFADHDEKLWLNMPEGTLTRLSNPIEFFELFCTEDLLELILEQTKL